MKFLMHRSHLNRSIMKDSAVSDIIFSPIGVIHTPFTNLENMPIQPAGAKGVTGEVHVLEQFQEGLTDLDGFSHIYLLYHFHMNDSFKLKVKPFMDNQERGLFSTRAPRRPNMIGLSVVRLLDIVDGVLHIQDVDVLDGTPLLDIKPYVGRFDSMTTEREGWLTRNAHKAETVRSDNRFVSE